MAPTPKKEYLTRYQGELARCINHRQSGEFDDLWRRMIDLYKGRHYDANDMSTNDRMVVNRAFAMKNVIAPSVAVNNPRFVVNARKADSGAQAAITEEVINYLWRAHKYKRQFRLAVDDFLTVGHGWIKVGYRFPKKQVVKSATVEDGTENNQGIEPGVDNREKVEGNVETEQINWIGDDRPFVERISVFDVFVDPDARSLDEARWIAQKVRRSVSDIRVDSRYSPTHRTKAARQVRDAHIAAQESDEKVGLEDNGNTTGFADVWEYYDLRENTVCTFLHNYQDGFLIDPAPMPYALGHPFVMMRNYEVPDEFFPMGELESIEILQKELNKTRTEMMLHRRGNSRQYMYDTKMVDDDGIQALKADLDLGMVPIDTTTGPLEQAIRVVPNHPINADSYNMSQIIEDDMDGITGVTDYMNGGQGANIRRTATEAAMIQDAQNARASDKLAGIEETLSIIAEKMIGLMQQYMKTEQVVRVVGSEAMPVWVTYDKDWIAGSFDFEVEGGSTQPRNESFRRQGAMQMMDALGPLIQMGVIDPTQLARKVLMDGFGVKDASMYLMQQQQPEEMMEQGMPQDPNQPQQGQPQLGPGPEQQLAEEKSPIEGIPLELINRLNVSPSPALAQG